MRYERRLLQAGETRLLGKTEYRIDGVEGLGGSAVVYQASYEDNLNRGYYHKVLIKELFPYNTDGQIYRDEDGQICCTAEAMPVMERYRERFVEGNSVNLELLAMLPEQISGNLDSFEAYGTLYTVMALHGGMTLERLLESRQPELRESAAILLRLLDVLECFHKNNLLHMDVSPDNILILPERVLLIDYNSFWRINRSEEAVCLSVKDGYSAPELRLENARAICPATDLYSVGAVFFRMLTGRRPSDDELTPQKLLKCIAQDSEVMKAQPVTVRQKTVQIIVKSMHMLVRKRYQTTEEMRADIRELIRRIDGRGITHCALWEGSCRDQKKRRQMEEPYLERAVCLEEKQIAESACMALLRDANGLLLQGPGGMGKTQFLLKLWEQETRRYRADAPVTVYIPLAGYQEAEGDAFFIRKSLLRYLRFETHVQNIDTAMHELELLLEKRLENGQPQVVLLLDGLNEAGSRRSGLLREVEKLHDQFQLGVLVSDRSDVVLQYGLKTFSPAELLPLSEEAAAAALLSSGIEPPQDQALAELLTNPMMLSLYKRTALLDQESGEKRKQVSDADGMIGYYLEAIRIQCLRMDEGNAAEQLRHNYLLLHVLPEAAARLERKNRTLLTHAELSDLCEATYKRLREKAFIRAFPEYTGKSREMCKDISDGREWFDYAVSEQLVTHLNLLVQSGDDSYRLIHDNFIPVLSRRAKENRRKIAKANRLSSAIKAGTGIVVVLLAVFVGAGLYQSFERKAETGEEITLSQEAQEALDGAVQRLSIQLSIVGMQLERQQDVLEAACDEQVLEGEEAACEGFGTAVALCLTDLEAFLLTSNGGETYLEDDALAEAGIRTDLLESLYRKPEELDEAAGEALKELQEQLCSTDIYATRARREKQVDVYAAYLDAYANEVYCELNLLLLSLPQEQQAVIMELFEETPVFQEMEYPSALKGDTSEEELTYSLEQAKDDLDDAESNMRQASLLSS